MRRKSAEGTSLDHDKKPPLPKREPWKVHEITENGKTWYEVRSGALAVSVEGMRWRTRFLRRAMHERDKRRKRDAAKNSRTERIIP